MTKRASPDTSPAHSPQSEAVASFVALSDTMPEKARLDDQGTTWEALKREVERRTRDLTESEESLRFVLQAGRLGSWSLDLRDMRFIASDTFKIMLGRNPNEPLDRAKFEASIYEDDRARRHEAIANCIAGHSNYDIEYRIVTPAGELRWLKIRGRPSYDL
ncbi:PAS domain-containing protein [Methylobacterium currus]|nr:PAS domain-containing protein [Methylobacterium currus]